MDVIEVTAANASDFIEAIAEIHAGAYSKGHLTSTFDRAHLVEYNRMLIEESDLSVVALDQDRVVGFIIAGETVAVGVSRFIAANRGYLILRFLRHPQFLLSRVYWKIVTTVRAVEKSAATFRLLSIATSPQAQSRGVGGRMLAEFEAMLKRKGVSRYGLSVLSRNHRAIAFYQRNGFVVDMEQFGSTYFYKPLSGPLPSAARELAHRTND